MKKVLIGVLAFIMALGLAGCGKSAEVKEVEEAISNIGEVTIDSLEAIQLARNNYDALTEEQQNKVENLALLTNAEKEVVELAKGESNRIMLERDPEGAIALLEGALPLDSSLQEQIDIIEDWCFDVNGVLLIKPALLYSGVELIGIAPSDSEHEFDTYFYSPITTDSFVDYVKYAGAAFVLNDEETLENASFARYRFLDAISGEPTLELTLFEYHGDLALGIGMIPGN